MVILCDISAWQYWRTPPLLREGWLSLERMLGAIPSNSSLSELAGPSRANAREADRLVRSRALFDLKGVALPIHVLVDARASLRAGALVVPHRMPVGLPPEDIVDIGNGLAVLSPEATACLSFTGRSIVETAKMMFEACGLFSALPRDPRLQLVVEDARAAGLLMREESDRLGVSAYQDERGKPFGSFDHGGLRKPWVPCFDARGSMTDLWKRPALSSVERMRACIARMPARAYGMRTARRAIGMVHDGAASPEEARACMLLCSGAWYGGMGWDAPDMNRVIPFTPSARTIARMPYCIGDMVWQGRRSILEVQGEAFHASEHGFRVATGRTAALESMGYAVAEVTHSQMADLELFDYLLSVLAMKLGFPCHCMSRAFLERRERLHGELFCMAYDPK